MEMGGWVSVVQPGGAVTIHGCLWRELPAFRGCYELRAAAWCRLVLLGACLVPLGARVPRCSGGGKACWAAHLTWASERQETVAATQDTGKERGMHEVVSAPKGKKARDGGATRGGSKYGRKKR